MVVKVNFTEVGVERKVYALRNHDRTGADGILALLNFLNGLLGGFLILFIAGKCHESVQVHVVRFQRQLTGQKAGAVHEFTYVIDITPQLDIRIINLCTAFVDIEPAKREVKVKCLEADGRGQHIYLSVLEQHLELGIPLVQDIGLGGVILCHSLQFGGAQGCG